MKVYYFYGFASSPLSSKATFFKHKFTNIDIDFQIVDLIPDQDSFSNMKTSKLLKKAIRIVDRSFDENLILFGSSFGGLIANWISFSLPEKISKIVLMAPALELSATSFLQIFEETEENWRLNNQTMVLHYKYNKELPLHYDFYKDLKKNPPPDFSNSSKIPPTLIFHGKNDVVVPYEWSYRYYLKNEERIIFKNLESDHQLLDQKEYMWKEIRAFLDI